MIYDISPPLLAHNSKKELRYLNWMKPKVPNDKGFLFKVFLTFSVNSYSVRCLKCLEASAKDFCHSFATQICLYGSIYMVPVSATLISTKCVSWSRLKKERQSRFPPTPTLTQLHISSHHPTPHLHIPISHFYTTPLCVLIDWLAAVRFSMIFCLFFSASKPLASFPKSTEMRKTEQNGLRSSKHNVCIPRNLNFHIISYSVFTNWHLILKKNHLMVLIHYFPS